MRERQLASTTHPLNFLMVLASDHITGATGITVTVTISKDGGSFGSPTGAITEIGQGWYSLAGNATDRNTLGSFLIHATGTGCDPADRDYTIVGYDPFNAQGLGLTALPGTGTLLVKPAVTLATGDVSGNLPANATQFAGQAITATAPVTIPASIGTSTFAGGAVSGVTGSVGSVTGAVGSVTGSVGSVTAPVIVGTNNDKSGYVLTQTFPAGFSTLTVAAIQSGLATSSALAGLITTVGTNGAGLISIPYTGPAALTDYQQRGVAVTLPSLPSVTVGGYATGQSPDTLVWAAGSRTLTAFGFTVSTSPVTLATSQPNYAPAVAGAAMTLTTAYDPAKTAAQVGSAMTLAANSIDLTTYTASTKTLLLRAYLGSTGSTTPATADQWYIGGTYNGVVYYQGLNNGMVAWNNTGGWTISAVLGTAGSNYWTTAGGANVTGPYTAQGGASGVPVVVAHGNAVLSAFQPDSPAFTLADGSITSAKFAVGATLPRVTLVDTATTLTGNTPQTGDNYPRLGAPAGASIAADIQTRSTFAGGAVSAVTSPVTVGTNNDKSGYALNSTYDPAKTAAQASNLTTVLTAVQSITNNSKILNLFGPAQLPIPATGSLAYEFDLVITDPATGALVNADSSPTVGARNPVAAISSAALSAVTNASTGRYKFTYTVLSSDTPGEVIIEVSATVNSLATGTAIAVVVAPVFSVSFTTNDRTMLGALYAVVPAHTPLIDAGGAVALPATLPPVTLAASQSNYAPATAAAVANLATTLGTPAQANQIPVNFTPALFANAGIFSPQALANTPEPSDVWTAMLPGIYAMGSAGQILGQYLDTRISTRSTYAGGPVAGVTAPVTVGVNNDKLGYKLAGDGLDAIIIETGINARQALSPILAACAGVVMGAGTGMILIKGGNSATTRISATTDNAGNRSSVTLVIPT